MESHIEVQIVIITFIIGIMAGVVISKHIGNWAIERLSESLKDKIEEAVNKVKEGE